MDFAWPKDNMNELCEFYGDPRGKHDEASKSWESKYLTTIPSPWTMRLAWSPSVIIRNIKINMECAEALEYTLRTIWTNLGRSQHAIEQEGLHWFGGSYNFRPIRGSNRLSTHAFGAAIDLNSAIAKQGQHKGMSTVAVDAFHGVNAYWGGNFKTNPDPMHFQFTNGA